ncbi:unnamed protein product [Arabis nemorensis]|uniref:Uncharacterized protein n=1 Tax=Arabis nemorensis TaxID=586526 RepID=A0A565ARZ7_9BRAS|nr:unnamed protein product [Arabis nemorensis]
MCFFVRRVPLASSIDDVCVSFPRELSLLAPLHCDDNSTPAQPCSPSVEYWSGTGEPIDTAGATGFGA